MKRRFGRYFVLLVVMSLFLAGAAGAADFNAWTNVWVKATLAEAGLTAPGLPTGGKITNVKERDSVIYLKFVSCDSSLAACNVSLCTKNASTNAYSLQTGLGAFIYGGAALDFLTSLSFGYQESTGVTETVTLPLRVKGTVTAGSNTLKTVSLVSVGGAYSETPEDQSRGEIGTATLKAVSLIPAAQVASAVPAACQP